MKKLIYIISVFFLLSSCENSNYLNVFPGDKITSESFWKNEDDVELVLNGIYSAWKESSNYTGALYPFGILEGATPNGYLWGTTAVTALGNGSLSSGYTGSIMDRWVKCYNIIYRANFLLDNIDKVELSEESRYLYRGEAHFLRGMAYALLAESYGGVPLITSIISAEESRKLTRSTTQETWNQAISDYDVAINSLEVDPVVIGRATKGAALGMKMRAYLYQNQFSEVLQVVEEIEALNKYSLFPSYRGLFRLENENNSEVIFDIQYLDGENQQGSFYDQHVGIKVGSYTRGTRVVPIQNLVDAYETIDGSPVDPDNPYENRDPRLDFTITRPGSTYLGAPYPEVAENHPGQRANKFAIRKYLIEPESDLPPPGQSSLNYIVIRYADVLLSKAEALIETNQNIDEAIALMNRIRTEREDVKIMALPMGMSQEEAREAIRHERRIEFAFEGMYWSDIKRWNIGDEIYPVEVRGSEGGLVETKFPNGYREHYNLLPIPDSEISLNPNLEQNPGW